MSDGPPAHEPEPAAAARPAAAPSPPEPVPEPWEPVPEPPALGRPSPAAARPALLRPAGGVEAAAYRADGGDDEVWAVRAASVAGVRHRLAGDGSEDAYAWARLPGAVALIVADGVGSVPGSGGAARRAVQAAGEAAAAVFGPAPAPDEDGSAHDPAGRDRLAGAACLEAVAAAGRAAGEGPGATTILVAVVTDAGRARLARVGDSTAFVLRGGAWHELFAADPDGGIGSTATAALPAAAPAVEPAEVPLGPDEALVLATDGIADPLRDGPTTVAPALGAALRRPPAPLALAWLTDFSRQGCHDDRTVLAAWRRAVSAD